MGLLLNDQGQLISDSYGMVNLLMENYSNMFSNPANVPPSEEVEHRSVFIEDISFTEDDISNAIDELSENSVPGLDVPI